MKAKGPLRRHLADALTVSRIIAALALLLVPPLSPGFYGCYLWAGISDMVDGTVARRLGTASRHGEWLDSLADMTLAAACLIRLLPVLHLPVGILLLTGAVALLRLGNVGLGYFRQRRLVFLHTRANRVTGILLFLFPFCPKAFFAAIVGLCALAASIQETFLLSRHITKNEHDRQSPGRS